jgi:hypothetical protein
MDLRYRLAPTVVPDVGGTGVSRLVELGDMGELAVGRRSAVAGVQGAARADAGRPVRARRGPGPVLPWRRNVVASACRTTCGALDLVRVYVQAAPGRRGAGRQGVGQSVPDPGGKRADGVMPRATRRCGILRISLIRGGGKLLCQQKPM